MTRRSRPGSVAAKARYRKLSNRTVDALKVRQDTSFWDLRLPGFGVRVYPSGAKIYIVRARGPRGPRQATVGRHGVISASQARRDGALMIARIRAGEEPLKVAKRPRRVAGPTVAEVAKRYMDEHVSVRCKPSSARTMLTLVRVHIVPNFGHLRFASLKPGQIVKLHHGMAPTPVQANLVVGTLTHMFKLAAGWGIVPEGTNPCRTVVKYRERKRDRYLTDAEYHRLGSVLDEALIEGGATAASVTAIRLLMLTGCRCNEILRLSWDEVDPEAGELRLRDSKTGPRTVSLSPMTSELLANLPRTPDDVWVIPGRKPGTHMRKLDTAWRKLRSRAGLHDVRLHDLRHSFASRALSLGESLPMIGKLLGHTQIATTARYAHLDRHAVHEAAERVANSIAAEIL